MFGTKIKKFSSLVVVMYLLTACVPPPHLEDSENQPGSQSHKGCKYIQRNLTVRWQNRTYWCIPDNKPKPSTPVKLSQQ